jgi:hypothetical protein
VIRQAISCDICGNEKRQTNHWFVAYDQAGELRVSGLSARNRLKAGTKHLCGQTCLHKLVDEFLARTLAVRITPDLAAEAHLPEQSLAAEPSAEAPIQEEECSARVVPATPPLTPRRIAVRAQPELVPAPAKPQPPAPLPVLPQEAPRIASKAWRSEAWQRERARELRDGTRSPNMALRRSGS